MMESCRSWWRFNREHDGKVREHDTLPLISFHFYSFLLISMTLALPAARLRSLVHFDC